MSIRTRINALNKAARITPGRKSKNLLAEEDPARPGYYHVYKPHQEGDPFEYPYNQTPTDEVYTVNEIEQKYHMGDTDILILLTYTEFKHDDAEKTIIEN